MDETIYLIFKVQFDFALEMWFSIFKGMQWLSCRELDSRLRGGGIEPHRRH